MTIIRIIVAVCVTGIMIYFYPTFHSMLDTLNGLATTLVPGMSTFDSTILGALPIVALGFIIWFGIQFAIGKIHGDNL